MTKPKPPGSPKKTRSDSLYKAEYAEQAEKLWGYMGCTDDEVAAFFGVSRDTLLTWADKHPAMARARKIKDVLDGDVVKSLYRRAMGYEHPDVVFHVVGPRLVRTAVTKHYPPDPASMIFWLKNRQREKWRDKPNEGDATLTPEELATLARAAIQAAGATTKGAK